ncbi:hypothetical protein TRIP_D300200 [uncultured Paludibacter sp.]|nr:hypothetical protein TRIP_D300200 [uncultured Paludibacter sp.]
MNKEFLVALLEKDIRELELLTEGFEDLDVFPKPILQLARQKAENIIKNLKELENISTKNDIKITDKEKVIAPAVEDEALNSDIEFLVNEEKKAEEKIEIPEVPEAEEIVKDEPVDFVEDLKEYGLQEKIISETMDKKQIEEKIVENEIEAIQESVLKDEKHEEVQPLQEKKEEPVIIKLEVEEPESNFGSVNDNIKIDDIRTAINIGDRFRFQRELFGGNGEVMNKTLAYLNQLAKYEEAVSFLNNKFGWDKDNQHAEDFLQIVRRRFL